MSDKKRPTLAEVLQTVRALEADPAALELPARRAQFLEAVGVLAEQVLALTPCPHITSGPRRCAECRAEAPTRRP